MVLPWYFDIKKYLETGTYPENATFNQKKSIRRMANNFFTSGEILYRRTPDLGLLRCIDVIEAAKLLEQIHAGVCGTHINGLTLARMILRAVWEMDVIGPIEPAASNGTLDSFWLPLTTLPSGFGVPESIIIDNRENLNSHLMREICEQFKITHRNSTAYLPQMNGVVEATNKNIKKILRKMIDNHRGWHEMLPYALLGYKTTVRTSIGATTYLLVYGKEEVIPAEVEIPSLRTIQEAELSNANWVCKRIDQLTLIDEKGMVDVFHGQLYQQRMIRAFNKKVRSQTFEEGQLVLKRIFHHQDEYKGKFAPNWQGPYIVRKVLSGGALILSEMDG
ncbi:uncharacterized protein [Solanum tuberosum]|uniref:uncharacterized protein n=1 Tax=Solanum tuberosum TaxID=4113 RepID=UPI00073A215C|nr:PREDICTED: uncharacterized protein LOC107062656 [Solanum tuberosum]